MQYSKPYLEKVISICCKLLQKNQPNLFKEEFDVNEETISSELASIMKPYFKDYHLNCEYNRMTDVDGTQIPKRVGLDPNAKNKKLVYPDIIIHRQEDRKLNLLIMELKMEWKNDRKIHDIRKLNLYIDELNYDYGLYLELGEDCISNMEWFT